MREKGYSVAGSIAFKPWKALRVQNLQSVKKADLRRLRNGRTGSGISLKRQKMQGV
jgi:hypothetical protein